MKVFLRCAAVLGLLLPAVASAQVAPNTNANRTTSTSITSDNSQSESRPQTNEARHAGHFRPFHSFTAPPAR